MAELEYVCDKLDPDGKSHEVVRAGKINQDCAFSPGVTLETNAHGKYLGHLDFEPIFEQLNRRKAIVFIHPTTPCMIKEHPAGAGCQPISPLSQYPAPMMEFLFDTARAIINMFMSGTISRYPDITYIVPHCGGTLAPLIDRFSIFGSLVSASNVDPNVTPAFVRSKLKSPQFYFDMAGLAWPNQCKMILPYITAKQLLYGSDFPFTSLDKVEMLASMMDENLALTFPDETQRVDIRLNNAVDLLERKGWKYN